MLSALFKQRIKDAGQVVEESEVIDDKVNDIFAKKVVSEAKYTYPTRPQLDPDVELDDGVDDSDNDSEDEDKKERLQDPKIREMYGSVMEEKDTVSTSHPRKRRRAAALAAAAAATSTQAKRQRKQEGEKGQHEEGEGKKKKEDGDEESEVQEPPIKRQRTLEGSKDIKKPEKDDEEKVEKASKDAKVGKKGKNGKEPPPQLTEEEQIDKQRKEKEKNKRTVFVSNFKPDTKKKELKKFFSSVGVVESVRFRSGFTDWHWQWMRDRKKQEAEKKQKEKDIGLEVELMRLNRAREKKGKEAVSMEEYSKKLDRKKTRLSTIINEAHRRKREGTQIPQDLLPDEPHKTAYVVFADVQPEKFPDKGRKGGRAVAKAATIQFNGFLWNDMHLRVDLATNSSKKLSPKVTVFIGNLPYTASEDPIWSHFEQCGEIDSVRLLRDKYKGGLCRGIGFIKFKKPLGARNAINLDGSYLLGRPVRVREITDNPDEQNYQMKRFEKNARLGKGAPFFSRPRGRDREGEGGRGYDQRDFGHGSYGGHDQRGFGHGGHGGYGGRGGHGGRGGRGGHDQRGFGHGGRGGYGGHGGDRKQRDYGQRDFRQRDFGRPPISSYQGQTSTPGEKPVLRSTPKDKQDPNYLATKARKAAKKEGARAAKKSKKGSH